MESGPAALCAFKKSPSSLHIAMRTVETFDRQNTF